MKPKRGKPEAVLVNANQNGLTYADMLRKVKTDVLNEEVSSKVTNTAAIKAALTPAVGEAGAVHCLSATATLEPLSVDFDVDRVKVRTDLAKALPESEREAIAVKSLRQGYRGTQTAVVSLPTRLVHHLFE